MEKLKLTGDLKKLLAVQGATDETVQLVESYFNSQAEALAEAFVEHSKPEPETPKKSESKAEMARRLRRIK